MAKDQCTSRFNLQRLPFSSSPSHSSLDLESMSGSAAGGGYHGGGQLYAGEDVVDSVFFQSPACSGGGDDGGVTPSACSSITDYLQGLLDPSGLAGHLDEPPCYPTMGEVIGAAAAPVTPNSSTSGEPAGTKLGGWKGGRPAPEEGDADEEGSADHQNCRSDEKEQNKKVKGEKKARPARGSRVAFSTKSEVDHLDDGYRWRKYGQKAVKNSSFPRSYYRCTAARCGVKKLVERSQQDSSTVVTTYEGRHAHPSPIAAHRGAHMLMAIGSTDIYSSTALQHQRYGVFPADVNTYAHMCTQPPIMEHRLSEYGGMQLHADLLSGALAGYQQNR